MTTSADKPLIRDSAIAVMRALGMEPDAWQVDALAGGHKRLLLNCCRQAGKSTTVAVLSVLEAVGHAGTKVLLLSRSLRQSTELFRLVAEYLQRIGARFIERRTANELDLKNFSRVISLPCAEATIRGYANVGLLVIDEAARVPDDLYRAVRPMLAVSDGRLVCLSTPYGRRGFFYDAWAHGGADWHRIEVPATAIPRIKPDFLAEERRAMGESWFRQEYCCSFEALEGLVYPNFARCLVASLPPSLAEDRLAVGCSRVGGLDFGLRNPFAALWGIHDRDGILWLVSEHYARGETLAYHARHLPRGVTWYADPSGAREILELVSAGFTVRPGDNAKVPGIAAVRARIENGTLRVLEGRCPNLLAEGALYRYDPEAGKQSEEPLKEHDHAMDALRYLISRLDYRHMARLRKQGSAPETSPGAPTPDSANPPPPKRKWLSLYNEALWTRIW
jgi:hypothetical protein